MDMMERCRSHAKGRRALPAARIDVSTKGRNAMKSLAIVTVLGLCAFATDAVAQSWQPPSPDQRCPSKWGAADERGSGNHMKPANVCGRHS
jgi:hypothetical protein